MVSRATGLVTTVLLSCVVATSGGDVPQERLGVGPLDTSGAFFHPAWGKGADGAVAQTRDGPVAAQTYMRYLAARLGRRHVEDLVFDDLLARECKERKLVRNAPLLARSFATQRFHGAGRDVASDPDGSIRRKFANEELRRMRTHAIVGADRALDPASIEELFNRRHGVGGQKVEVRQVLVSLGATRRRLGDATDAAVDVAARSRAEGLRRRLARGDEWTDVLAESDDRSTRTLLRDPARRDRAGFLDGYNYRRYGLRFATVVRGLDVGAVSDPVKTDTGYHVVRVVSRKITRLKDALGALREELRARPASLAETSRLKKKLFEKYEVKIS
ncbi:MAG: peptidylprolyl isomerase [Planctomycetes bacterium]|nr:peptidylprolyl isomerase [Planctomycetota bacterium]